MDQEKCIDVCNKLLRGELSAIETYDQAIEKFSDEPQVAELRTMKADHVKNANLLQNNVQKMGGKPSTDSGAWGTFAQTVQGTAKLFGDAAALKALKEGEEHGRKEYESAIENEHVLPDCKQMIRSELLPRQVEHVKRLDSLIAQC